jgi:hypothetical protein
VLLAAELLSWRFCRLRQFKDRSLWIGSMKDSIEIVGDIVSPANEEREWEVLRD